MTETVLITGAGIGIGRAAAMAFAKAGHHVVVTDVLQAEGKSCVEAIKAAGGSAEFHVLDVRSTEAADALVARIEADPTDHEARIELALALAARGERKAAVDHLVESVRRERGWNEEAARKQLVQLFEAWGPTDPDTLYGRRRLSSVLFS